MLCCSRLVDMDQAEWLELVQLELPSILGLAAPGADVLDISEPTFWTQEDTEEESDFASDTSMGLYSPSPCRSVLDGTPGFNLLPPSGFAQLQDEPSHAGEQLAKLALQQGWVGYTEMLRLAELLPSSLCDFQEENASTSFVQYRGVCQGKHGRPHAELHQHAIRDHATDLNSP